MKTLIASPLHNLSTGPAAVTLETFPSLEVASSSGQATTEPITEVAAVTWKDVVNAYIALTKPRIISLLLFTTLAAMFVANDAQHPVTLLMFLAVAVGGYMAAGAANTINMVIDRDIDGRMARTAMRPTVTKFISKRAAMIFATTLALLSCMLLWKFGCLLSAALAMAGLAFYVVIYTLILKRRTWQNIVWGGAAGAFPPLVGWTAVTHDLNAMAWMLFAIIFFWTPVHFWALAILLKEDYSKAGIPMLPSVRGERVTVVQIAYYTAITVALTLAPFQMRYMSWIYLASAILLNIVLVRYCAKLYMSPERPQAKHLFHYSMLYLALLFLAMALDHNLLHI